MKINFKYIKYLLFGAILFTTVSCEDYLDVDATDKMTDEVVWSDMGTIKAALAGIYAEIYLEDFDYYDTKYGWDVAGYYLSAMSDEAVITYVGGSGGTAGSGPIIYPDELFAFMGYDRVRHCNTFLKGIDVTTALVSEEEKAQLKAEARLIRAIHYFNMVKRHGGVPLITREQSKDEPLDSLIVGRSKEQEIWDFIGAELDYCAQNLPNSRSLDIETPLRFTKWTALSFKSRAMLYAASIAKYGKMDLNGLIGVNAADANKYWKAAYDAANEVILHGPYKLYDAEGDKTTNFRNLFLKNNNEYIIWEEYSYPGHPNNIDLLWTPHQFRDAVLGYGNMFSSTIELAEAFEYIDGSMYSDSVAGPLKLTENNNLIRYKNPVDLFKGKDPRLLATLYVPGDNCRGGILDVRRGVLSNGEFITTNDVNAIYPHKDSINKIFILGASGVKDDGDYMKTGMCPKKFCDETNSNLDYFTSNKSWPMLRMAEVYLNAAEAAFELGNTADAVNAINPVRSRAGISLLNESSISLNRIRNERFVEFAFENQRFWDLRRWRIAHTVLDQFKVYALWPWYDWQQKAYAFTIGEAPKGLKLFLEKSYYIKFPDEHMNSNPKLIQNPGY